MVNSFVALIATRYEPFNFSNVPGFPNPMLDIKEWGDYLPKFKEDDEDSLAQHLTNFHEYMHHLGIFHEDTLTKLFMFSLDGYP